RRVLRGRPRGRCLEKMIQSRQLDHLVVLVAAGFEGRLDSRQVLLGRHLLVQRATQGKHGYAHLAESHSRIITEKEAHPWRQETWKFLVDARRSVRTVRGR